MTSNSDHYGCPISCSIVTRYSSKNNANQPPGIIPKKKPHSHGSSINEHGILYAGGSYLCPNLSCTTMRGLSLWGLYPAAVKLGFISISQGFLMDF